MEDFEKLISIADSPDVTSGVNLPKVHLHKWLVLGQTDYLCENGTLSDGHEKLTDAQKYAQALKEYYYLSLNVQNNKALGMEAQADIIEATECISSAKTDGEKLRSQAKMIRSKAALITALTTVEEQMRMIKCYMRVITKLKPSVESRYPEGIEQAEKDNWTAVYRYRMVKEKTPGIGRERTDNIPLDAMTKAALGYNFNRPDSIAPLAVSNPEAQMKMELELEERLKKQKIGLTALPSNG